MMEPTWLDRTCIGDQIETRVHLASGRIRWRLAKLKMPGARRLDDMYDDRPWSQHPIPENLKPHWMKRRETGQP